MDMTELNRELQDCRERMARRERLLAQWKDLNAQREERQERERETGRILAREERDVETLEGFHPKAVWLRLTGDRETRLSREEREALAARLQHDQAVRDLEEIDRRIGENARELDALPACGERYQELLAQKSALLRQQGGETGARLARVEETLAQTGERRRELREAVRAGEAALHALSAAEERLRSAEDWGTWDLLGGGLLADLEKHAQIDAAQELVGQAQSALSAFRTELADVRMTETPSVQVGEFSTFADFFFDGLFADWAVQEQIGASLRSVADTAAEVRRILRILEDQDRREEACARTLEEERAALLERG